MYEISKRILDLVSAILVLIFFSPVFLIAPILIKLDSPGPVFYKQRRVGKNGQEFWIYKFRNMVCNADDFLIKNIEFNKRFKNKSGWKVDAKDDPRITRVGKWLRKFSLDELPQVINILKGEMSMVGPRAYRNDAAGNEIEEQLKIYPELRSKIKRVLTVKPGLTGPWQTSGRNKLPWDKRVELDTDYANNRSILYDLLIVLKTPFAMLSKW
jgi:lipopolysaccharide/colanic/teichoic acid biosynthesis glycosyltransferase